MWLGIALWLSASAARGDASAAGPAETVGETACRIVESAARSSDVPVGLLTRLVWVESRFQADVTSPAGAQGIAQFMPETAAERGLTDPFDPEQAIPKAARLLAGLNRQFGNFGLAAAAYNAGPNRVAGWLAGASGIPPQTQAYVFSVTGRSVEDWAADRRDAARARAPTDRRSCVAITAALKAEERAGAVPVAPWGVQLAGNFSKGAALASFERARRRFYGLVRDLRPMIIGTVLRSRGTRPFYRVLVPASSRAKADRICRSIEAGGGACVALKT
ncbi:MAG TPA: lytic transglycosylase domain-containing protein [Stellaceae bacterium]|nr:lytic transglycosylase domain-containing protein [Stellaceae bacterium]